MKAFGVGAMALMAVFPTLAAEPVNHLPASPVSFLQVIFGLGFVLVLIFAAGWILRKLTPSTSSNSVVKIINATAVGQRERVVVIEISNNWLVLGVAPGQVNLLQSLPKESTISVEATAPVISFVDKFKEAAKRYVKR